VALSSALKATIALLIVVVVTVVVVVVSRPYPTVPGQMANPIAVTAPSVQGTSLQDKTLLETDSTNSLHVHHCLLTQSYLLIA
ncbi:hypothetical protein Tco_1038187, partial [Tanacetum coccineum]